MQLKDKNVVIIGGSGGVGRVIAQTASDEGAHVLAVARRPEPLAELESHIPVLKTLSADATLDDAPGKVFAALRPDVLVLCGGARPPLRPIHEQTWDEFSQNWNNDVRSSFLFCQVALQLPLAPGTVIVLISSGAAIGGSAISGGYAGSKRMQMFMAEYCQSESDRHNLGLRFITLVPSRIMPDTELGRTAVSAYAERLGIPIAEFIKESASAQTPQDMANALVSIAADPDGIKGSVFVVSGEGVKPY